MARLLAFGPAWRRVAPLLGEAAGAVEPVLMAADGTIEGGGAPSAEIAWLSADLFEVGAMPAFMAAALASPDLRWLHSAAAGFDHPVFRRIVGKGARLTTSHGHAVGIADYVLWGVLDFLQRGPERREAQRTGKWRRLRVREIAGTTWLIFGFGAIGGEIARRARAFGARIVGVRRRPGPDPLADEIVAPDRLFERLGGADVVVLAAPSSGATRRIAGAGFFAAMKPGSALVNIGRGALLDEAALVAALNAGRPAFALLDVFETEPLPADSPLWNHPQVRLTAHASALTDGQAARLDAAFIANLKRFAAGAPLIDEIPAAEVLAEG